MSLPAWVYKRDGRLVPFEAERIHRSLFMASETLGRPDAFLARELTDGVLHFLGIELEEGIPTTIQVRDLVEKVVRELGQPELARAYARFVPALTTEAQLPDRVALTHDFVNERIREEGHPLELARVLSHQLLREFSVREVYSRDVLAAQEQGLLTLTGLSAPLELAAWVARPPREESWTNALETARGVAGSWLALDAPEHVCLAYHRDPKATAREIATAARLMGLNCVLALNAASPPAWTAALAAGPLFGDAPRTTPDDLRGITDAMAADLLVDRSARKCVRLDWHLGDRDFKPDARDRVLNVARRTLEGAAVAFVFDRPRMPVSLAEGLDRSCPGVLAQVGLHLPALLERTTNVDEFLRRLPSLARLAIGVGLQKRDFLRRWQDLRPELAQGFLLDRARFIVTPIGLDAAARVLTGERELTDRVLEVARKIVGSLVDVLAGEGRGCRLDIALDSALDFFLTHDLDRASVGGLTFWDEQADARRQLETSGQLHALARTGTAVLLVPRHAPMHPEELVDLLAWCWTQTGVRRLRLIRRQNSREQQAGLWR